MPFYNYRQNNPNGSFIYDEKYGLSVNTYVEANDASAANSRAATIGLYFENDRWFEKDESLYDAKVPEPEAPILHDEFDSYGTIKWIKDGYETFVHPLDKPFYGAHKDIKVIRKLTYGGKNGHGVRINDHDVGNLYSVSELGWDKTGNRMAPSPFSKKSWFEKGAVQEYTDSKDNICVRFFHNEIVSFGLIWFLKKQQATKFINLANEYLDVTPRPKLVQQVDRLIKEII